MFLLNCSQMLDWCIIIVEQVPLSSIILAVSFFFYYYPGCYHFIPQTLHFVSLYLHVSTLLVHYNYIKLHCKIALIMQYFPGCNLKCYQNKTLKVILTFTKQ